MAEMAEMKEFQAEGTAPPWLYGLTAITVTLSLQFLLSLHFGSLPTDRFLARRKIQHASSCFVLAIIGFLLPRSLSIYCLVLSLIGMFLLHRLRLRWPALNQRLLTAFRPLLRPHEAYSLPGSFYVLLGCLFVRILFTTRITVLCVFALGLGDPVASAVGTFLATRRHDAWRLSYNGKSCVACLASAVVLFVTIFAAFVAFSALGIGVVEHVRALRWSVCTAIYASLFEWLSPPIIDDNLLMPACTAVALHCSCQTGLLS